MKGSASSVTRDVRSPSVSRNKSPPIRSAITRPIGRSPSGGIESPIDQADRLSYEACNRNQRDDQRMGGRDQGDRQTRRDQHAKRNRSPAFTREESQPPVISDDLWGAIKANGRREHRGGTASHASSSKRRRGNSRDTEGPSNVDLLVNVAQISNRTPIRFATDPTGDPFVDSAADSSTVGKFFSSHSQAGRWSDAGSPRVRRFSSPQGQEHLRGEIGLRNVISRAINPSRRAMGAPSLPLMNDYRRFVNPPGRIQADHSMNAKYGEGTAVRTINEHARSVVYNEGDGKYFRRNPRLNGESKKRATRRASEELRMLLFRPQRQGRLDPFLAFTVEEVAFARLPYRYRVLAETGDRARVKILAWGGLRSIRHRLGLPGDRSFYHEFNSAVSACRDWHNAQYDARPMSQRFMICRWILLIG